MKILHIDIETMANQVWSWGLFKQNIGINQIDVPGYTMCWAAKWHGKREVLFESIPKCGADRMIERAWELLDEADAIVTYNGRGFDLPTLKREFVERKMPPPSPHKDIDLLQVVRSQFRFASNKLDYVAQQLGLGCKTHHKGMDLWKECAAGCPKAWAIMERYNKQDVRLTERLYKRLLPWIQNHPNWGLYADAERPTCRNCGSTRVIKKGKEYTTTQVYQRYKCTSCGKPLRGRTRTAPAPDGVLV